MTIKSKLWTLTEEEGWNLVCIISEAREKIHDELELLSAIEEDYEITDEQNNSLL